MRRLSPAFVVVALLATPLAPAPARTQASPPVPDPSGATPRVWALGGIYRDSAAWAVDAAVLERQLAGLEGIARGVRPNASSVAWALERAGEARRRAARLAVYGVMSHDADARSPWGATMRDSGQALERLTETAVAPVERAIAALPATLLRELVATHAQVWRHRRTLASLLRDASRRSAPDAALLAAQADSTQQATLARHRSLLGSDIGWRTVRDARGREVLADRATAGRLGTAADDSVRRTALRAYYGRLRDLADPFADLMERRIETEDAAARARHYTTGLEAALDRDGVPVAAVDTLVRVARDAAPLLRRYTRARARIAGAGAATYDRLRAVSPPARRIGLDESQALIARAFAPLGHAYVERLRQRFTQPWWHLAGTPGKRDIVETYYGSVLGGHPGVLMVFRDDIASSVSLAAATTQLMALADIPRMSGPVERQRPLVWSATLGAAGRVLHDDQLRRDAQGTPHEREALIRSLEDIRLRFFRNAIYAELERLAADRVRATGHLGGAHVLSLYARILRDYYTASDAGQQPVHVLPEYEAEWIGNESLFRGYDATRFGIAQAAALHLVTLARSESAAARRAFMGSLGTGDSDLTYDLLRDAGVDLATGGPYRAAVRRFEELLEELERGIGGQSAQTPPAVGTTWRLDAGGVPVVAEVVATDLDAPSGLAVLPDGRLLIGERRVGRLSVLEPRSMRTTPITGLPPAFGSANGGLLDIVLHPRYAENRWIYFAYSVGDTNGSTTVVDRARLVGARLVDRQRLFTAQPIARGPLHYGSRLVLHDGYLLIPLGDRDERERSQDLAQHHGKVIRIHDDGRVPRDNPFVGQRGALAEIWSYGHRNPQGLTLHPVTGAIWEHEHGPRGGDEVNVVRRGANYGWPITSFGEEYTGGPIGEGLTERVDIVPPVYVYVPSIAPSGMLFYRGAAFPAWRGSLLIGGMAARHLNRLEPDGTRVLREERLFEDRSWRIRNLAEGPDGILYLGLDDGYIVRLRPH
jgi:glucose/arabinose dehydrogenase